MSHFYQFIHFLIVEANGVWESRLTLKSNPAPKTKFSLGYDSLIILINEDLNWTFLLDITHLWVLIISMSENPNRQRNILVSRGSDWKFIHLGFHFEVKFGHVGRFPWSSGLAEIIKFCGFDLFGFRKLPIGFVGHYLWFNLGSFLFHSFLCLFLLSTNLFHSFLFYFVLFTSLSSLSGRLFLLLLSLFFLLLLSLLPLFFYFLSSSFSFFTTHSLICLLLLLWLGIAGLLVWLLGTWFRLFWLICLRVWILFWLGCWLWLWRFRIRVPLCVRFLLLFLLIVVRCLLICASIRVGGFDRWFRWYFLFGRNRNRIYFDGFNFNWLRWRLSKANASEEKHQ